MRNLNYLEDENLDIPSYVNLRDVIIANGILDTKTLMGNICQYLTSLNLSGFDWTFSNIDFTTPQNFLIEKLFMNCIEII